jgi:NADPH:quinone reductase-like Zn-dependent oxidoreductase
VCLPATPGADVVGTIEEMGDDVPVDSWSIGNRVAALVRTGGNARYIVVPYTSLVHVPKSLDAAQAVSMVSTYMTAYQSLKLTLNSEEKKGAKPFAGKKILVVGGGSPVGEALIQLSLKAGATEVYATGQQKLSKFLKGLGATPLGYESEEWLPPVKGKMDLVFDGVCQDGYDSSQLALQDHGKLVTVGMVGKLQSEGPGLLGAPLSAFITDAKASLFMSKTQTYDAWASFQHDPETYKVRTNLWIICDQKVLDGPCCVCPSFTFSCAPPPPPPPLMNTGRYGETFQQGEEESDPSRDCQACRIG